MPHLLIYAFMRMRFIVMCKAGSKVMRLSLLVFLSLFCICNSRNANLVLAKDAVTKVGRAQQDSSDVRVIIVRVQGAVCLDGSAPGYYIRRASSAGEDKWILHLEGGGWCGDEADCLSRSKTALGSSINWPLTAEFHGFLSDNVTVNPDFYNWNMVYLMYCDGSSFSGNRLGLLVFCKCMLVIGFYFLLKS